jgi:cellulose biosynthesis protein BcsQ
VGPSALRYREIADLERCRGAAVQRGLAASAEPCSAALSSPCSAVAFVSCAGRVGKTTLAAHLCAALAARGARAAAVDLDPKGELRRALAPEHPCLTPSPDEVLRLRRGALARGGRDPKAVAQELAAAHAGWEVLVTDTGSEPTPALELAEAAAEVLLLVVTPEALNAAPRAMDRMAGGAGGLPGPFLLMNGFDNRREDHRSAFAALRGAYGERVLPEPVHYDPAFRERFGGAPHSQAAADVEHLARWVQGPQGAIVH